MNVLIGCETSGTVRSAFRKLNRNAISCDLLPADDGSEHHWQDDVRNAIVAPSIQWDLIIMHPECTKLCVSGNRWYGKGKPKHSERIAAIEWTMNLWELAKQHATRVCMENPVGVLPLKATQFIQPWQFGHGETKKTGLWLHNLKPLQPTNIVDGRVQRIWKMAPSPDRWKIRSKTYQGIADAMAMQWRSSSGRHSSGNERSTTNEL
jgi:hypothetical protein